MSPIASTLLPAPPGPRPPLRWAALVVFGSCACGGPMSERLAPSRATLAQLPVSELVLDDGAEDALEVANVDQLDRGPFVRAVLERNPTLAQSREAWRAALARAPQRTALPDPMVELSLAPLSIGAAAPFGGEVGIRQRIPWPGKLALAGEIAAAEAEAAREDHDAVRRRLALMASLLFDAYYAVDRSLELNDAHRLLLEQIRVSAESQYLTGRGSPQEPLQAELELAHVVHQRVMLEASRRVLVAQMNELLHRGPELPLPPPPRRLDTSVEIPDDSAALQQRALAARSDLGARRSRLEASRSALALAERAFIPDLQVMTSYSSMWPMPEHGWMLGIALDLPLQIGARLAAMEEAEARLAASHAALVGAEASVRSEVEQARSRLHEARHVLKVYEERLLPTARAQVEAARIGYETGRNSFQALIDAERSLRNLEIQYQDAVAELGRRTARLVHAVGDTPGLEPFASLDRASRPKEARP